MKPPSNAEVFETSLSTMWFDAFGIFHSVTKRGGVVDKDSLDQIFEFIKKKANGKKICWVSDISNAAAPTKEGRDYGAQESRKFVKGLALITNSALSRTIAEIYLLVKKPPYPTRIFTDETKAIDWLSSFCEAEEEQDIAV